MPWEHDFQSILDVIRQQSLRSGGFDFPGSKRKSNQVLTYLRKCFIIHRMDMFVALADPCSGYFVHLFVKQAF
jgi:hypothetical protein